MMRPRLAPVVLAAVMIAAPAAAADPVGLFEKLCVNGEARFARDDVAVVDRQAMPRAVRRALPLSSGEKIYEVRGTRRAFLILQGDPRDAQAGGSCSLIAQDVAPGRLVTTMLGRPLRGGERETYNRGGAFRYTTTEGAMLSTEVLPPDFVLATVRQGMRGRRH